MGTMSYCQPENWLYEIWQKGQDSPCYVMVPNANDLVKSHLMIAVREEVEVLKEKITELMEKINLLEVENTILKKNVPQETLTDLQSMLQQAAAATATAAQQQQTQQPQSQTTQPQTVVTANTQQQQQSVVPPTVVAGATTGPQTAQPQQQQQPTNGPVA